MKTIKDRIAEGRKILVIELVTGTVSLSRINDVFRRPNGAGPVQFIAVDLEELHNKFQGLPAVQDKTSFSITEVAAVAGVKKHTINFWIGEGLVKPSVTGCNGRGKTREFCFDDVLTAGLIGSLQRNHVPLKLLYGVADCLSQDESTPAKKATSLN